MRSHFDHAARHVSGAVRSSANAMQGAIEQASYQREQQNSAVLEQLEEITGALEGIGEGLIDVRHEIERTNSILDFGLTKIIFELGQLNKNIGELIDLTNNPSRTHAYEQFSLARELLARDMYGEAYRHIKIAINGDSAHSGYPLEYRFFLLQGTLQLGSPSNYSSEIVSPIEAAKSFRTALTLAKDESNEIQCVIACLGGRASYCAGNFEASADFFDEGRLLDPKSFDARYHLGRVYVQNGLDALGERCIFEALSDYPFFSPILAQDQLLSNNPISYRVIKSIQERLAERWRGDVKTLMECGLGGSRLVFGSQEFVFSIQPPDFLESSIPEGISKVEKFLREVLFSLEGGGGSNSDAVYILTREVRRSLGYWETLVSPRS